MPTLTRQPAIGGAPVAAAERMDVLDVIRGVAVLGILLINIETFSGYGMLTPAERAALPQARFDAPLAFALRFLVEGKFYSLFSFLFGVGFFVFFQRASARAAAAHATRLFKRRLTGLLLIGLAHSFLLWYGDILASYAVLGFALIPFTRRDDRAVLRWSMVFLASPVLLYVVLMALAAMASVPPPRPGESMPPVLTTAANLLAHGTLADFFRGNAIFTAANVARRLVLMFFPRVLGMFLLGYWAGRRGIFTDLDAHTPLLRRVAVTTFAIGLPLALADAILGATGSPMPPDGRGLLRTAVQSIASPALALGYAAGLCLLFRWRRAPLLAFAPAGRMALTNYLLQSVAGVAVFSTVGLELFGRVSLTDAVAGCVMFFAIQCAASRLWLSIARFGPVEWLWRSFTYRRAFPLIRT